MDYLPSGFLTLHCYTDAQKENARGQGSRAFFLENSALHRAAEWRFCLASFRCMKRFITAADVQRGSFPWCTVEWLSNPELVGTKELLLVRATFPAGEAHNFHRHPGREEIIYVLKGEADQWVGRDVRRLKAGEMAHIPKDTPHATFNPGPATLEFLAILSPVEAPGEFTVDVFNEEPWVTLRPPIRYPGQS